MSITSSDSDYEGVNEISDSDDENEKDVLKAERRAIIAAAESEDSPRPQDIEDYSDYWGGFDDSPAPIEELSFFDDHIARGHEPDLDAKAIVYNATSAAGSSDSDSTVTPRRVRFDLSGSDDEDSEIDALYSDVFFDQNSLNPAFRQQIEQDNEDQVSIDGGHWDYGSEQEEGGLSGSDDSDDSDSSGYDSEGVLLKYTLTCYSILT